MYSAEKKNHEYACFYCFFWQIHLSHFLSKICKINSTCSYRLTNMLNPFGVIRFQDVKKPFSAVEQSRYLGMQYIQIFFFSIQLVFELKLYGFLFPIVAIYWFLMYFTHSTFQTIPQTPDKQTSCKCYGDLAQIFINPISGHIIDKIGYDLPMMFGITVMFFSTLMFACGSSYGVLFFARSLQVSQ